MACIYFIAKAYEFMTAFFGYGGLMFSIAQSLVKSN